METFKIAWLAGAVEIAFVRVQTERDRAHAAIRKAAGNPNLNVTKTPWALMRLLSPFVPLFREVCEMRYLWQMRVHMNNAKLCEACSAKNPTRRLMPPCVRP